MRNLGMMLRTGQGVVKDPKQAEELFLRAAQAGLPTAQADLADMLLKGEAGPPDLGAALPLLQAAAAAHHPVAQFELGELYETGAPPLVPQNLEVARQLYAAAAEHGMKEAAERLRVVGPPAAAKPAGAQTAGQPATATPQAAAPVTPAAPPPALAPAPAP
jgi:TPR repeat protein